MLLKGRPDRSRKPTRLSVALSGRSGSRRRLPNRHLNARPLRVIRLEERALLSLAPLDPSFGTGGLVITPIGAGDANDVAYDVAIQADGKIVVAGTALARYNADGTLDTTFGAEGKVALPLQANAVALDADGKILLAGAALMRYNSDGSLDTSFDGDGIVTTDLPSKVLSDIAIDADGKIVVAGRALGTDFDFVVLRYNTDGSLDTSFDGDGIVSTDFDSHRDEAYGVAIDSQGRIVVAGTSQIPGSPGTLNSTTNYFALTRYNSDGSLDATFDGDGKVITDFNPTLVYGLDIGRAVAVDGQNRIVVAGESVDTTRVPGWQADFALARYNTDGSLDTTFGGQGTRTTGLYLNWDGAYDVAIDAMGRIVMAGTSNWQSPVAGSDFAVARFNTNGSLDPAFQTAFPAVTTTDFAPVYDQGYALAYDRGYALTINGDGNIIVVGSSTANASTGVDFALARYTFDLPPKAGNDTAVTHEGTSVSIAVTGNDTSYRGTPLAITVLESTHGVAVVNDRGTPGDAADDKVDFTPAAGCYGVAGFTYKVNDGQDDSNVATVTITVLPFTYVSTGELEWVEQFGSPELTPQADVAQAVDAVGNVYVVGYTDGSLADYSAGFSDAFVRKYDVEGNVVWTRQFGTNDRDYATGVSADGTGVYVTGYTSGSLAASNAGSEDVFLRKYDADGNVLWTQQLGTTTMDRANAISLDATGVYVAGETSGSLAGSSAGGSDVFLLKYDGDGTVLWTKQFGTATTDRATAISLDATGVYVTGETSGSLAGPNAGFVDAFVQKYDANGNVVWSEQFGTTNWDYAKAVFADATGVHVAGYTQGSLGGSNAGGYDAFMRKCDADGNVLWTRQFGTTTSDWACGVSADSTGVYVSGYTYGSLGAANAGSDDAFVRKFDVDGNVLWTRQFGTTSSDRVYGISADCSGVYVTGYTYGSLGGSSAGLSDAFVQKFDADGNAMWTQQLGGAGQTSDTAAAVAAAGNIYVTGTTSGGLGAPNAGNTDVLLRKYDAEGNVVWTRQFGTTVGDAATGVSADGTGVYVTGYTYGGIGGPNAGHYDAFVRKYDADGNVIWTNQFGTSSLDRVEAICVDGKGVYVAGYTQGSLGLGRNAGWDDAFVRKYDADGNVLWTRQFGTGSQDYAYGISVDSTGVYVTGSTYGSLGGPKAGDTDVFVRKYDAYGNAVWTTQFGTTTSDYAWGISVDGTGVYVAGNTWGSVAGSNAGGTDAFVRKYSAGGNVVWTRQFGTANGEYAYGISVDSTGAYVSGYTSGSLAEPNAGFEDAFLRKYDAEGTVVWTKQFGTTGNDTGRGVAVDVSGVYVTGYTTGRFGSSENLGGYDAFLAKIVENIPPVADAGGPYTTAEGTAITFDACGSIDLDGDALQCRWDFDGDGTWDTEWSTEPTAAHAWADNWSGNALVEVTDGFSTAVDVTAVTILNVAPVPEITGAPASSSEGTAIILGSTVTDPGSLDTFTYAWTVIRDGDPYASGNGSAFNFTPDDNAAYEVTLTVCDNDGGVGSDSLIVTVGNAPPAVEAGVDQTADEGQTVSMSAAFTDAGLADTHTAVIDWGDGTTESVNPAGNLVTGSHVYVDNGTYTVTVTVTDDDLESGGDSLIVTVLNVAPSALNLTLDPECIDLGGSTLLSGTFVDPGTLDPHTVVIDWGDARSDTLSLGPNVLDFNQTHQYLDGGFYTVGVTVSDTGPGDDDSATGSAALVVGGRSSIASNFNGTAIAAGNSIWFNSVVGVSGVGSEPVTIHFVNSTIDFAAGGTDYHLSVPDAVITISPTATLATTTFVGGTWTTTVPSGLGGNIFLAGLSFPVGAALPGGINPVTWQGQFWSDTPGIQVQWKWGAAVYTSFSADHAALGVKPVDDNQASEYKNSDHAGAPENFKTFVIGGARGGGGSNYTGSYSGTAAATPVEQITPVDNLAIEGTSVGDTITVTPKGSAGLVGVVVNGAYQGTFAVAGEVQVSGGAGNDTITVSATGVGGLTIDGQGGSDAYTVNFGGLVGNVTVDDSGTGGDTLWVNGTPQDDVIVKTAVQVTWGIPVAETVLYSGVESVVVNGGHGHDHITDPGGGTTILGGPGNDTIIITATSEEGVFMDGEDGSDTYAVNLGMLAGPVTVLDSGPTGTDAITVYGTTGRDEVTVNGPSITPEGGATISVNASLESVIIDTLEGDDQVTVASGSVVPLVVTGTTTEARVEGTEGPDCILFTPGTGPGEIVATLNGVSLGTFTAPTRLVADGKGGDDDIQVAGSIELAAWLYGGSGNDRLKGGAGHDVLLGEDGDDLLVGQSGRDILIGGMGSDRIAGNADDDILIAGYLAFLDLDEALEAIRAEWTSERSYYERIENLTARQEDPSLWQARANDNYFLIAGSTDPTRTDTVEDDGFGDVLTGSSGLDWFFFNEPEDHDRATDLKDEVFANVLDWIEAEV